MSLSLKRKILTDEQLIVHVTAFRDVAGDALGSSDTSEGWNAAYEYAKKETLNSSDITRILTVFRSRREIPAALLNEWLREGAKALNEDEAPDLKDQIANRDIQAHATSTKWDHREMMTVLCNWAELFNIEFFLGHLPPPAISIERTRVTTMGSYRLNRDGLGLKFRITINELYLGYQLAVTLDTLLHEMIHQWEEVQHGRKRGGSYHTRQFRNKAADLGIPTDDKGYSLGIALDGRFARLLHRQGVDVNETSATGSVKRPRKSSSRLHKWSCGCTNVWASEGRKVMAHCLQCNEPFERGS